MTTKEVRDIIQKINNKERVDNETLFRALRLAENNWKKHPNAWHWKRRIETIKNQLVVQNEGLIRTYMGKISDEDELESELRFAVARAINAFDVERGNKWSTYLTWCLIRARSKIQKQIQKDRRLSLNTMLEVPGEPYDEPHPDLDLLASAWDNAELTDREKYILYCRFYQRKRLWAIGDEYGLSKERIRQLQNTGIEKLRAYLPDSN